MNTKTNIHYGNSYTRVHKLLHIVDIYMYGCIYVFMLCICIFIQLNMYVNVILNLTTHI